MDYKSQSFVGGGLGNDLVDYWITASSLGQDHSSLGVEHQEGGHGLDLVVGGSLRVDIHIHLHQIHSVLLALLLDVGGDALAGAAPLSVEINHGGLVLGELSQKFGKGSGLFVVSHLQNIFINISWRCSLSTMNNLNIF
jgi:hypothetical protein